MNTVSIGNSRRGGHEEENGARAAANPRMAAIVESLLKEIGEDPAREGLVKTPDRVARSWEFLTSGYGRELDDVVNGAIFQEDCSEIVLVKHIHFFSLCEHHLLPFYGVCSVAYIPDGKIIGLSKIPRIVDMFARRLQVQERLTQQIAHAVEEALAPAGVAVTMEAFHMCMMMRGVEKQDSRTVTSAMLGAFRDNPLTRQEYLNLLSADQVGR